MGQHCFFLHSDDIEKVSCRHYIQIRDIRNSHLFNGAKKYVWLHDVGTKEKEWIDTLSKEKIKVLTVSRWHYNNIKELTGYEDIDYIYNPTPDELFLDANAVPAYDKNLLVWMSSPHKGLGRALELFQEMRTKNDKLKLVVFNPGYLGIDTVKVSSMAGVSVYGATGCKAMWNIVRQALCVFYPTQWDETFGLVASEANALGTPVATFRRAALKEVVSSELQFSDSEEELMEKVLGWSANGRPVVRGKEEFKLSNVIIDWLYVLAK